MSAPMRFAYADPPYLGYSSFYADLHPDAMDYDDPATHRALIDRLDDEFDGWALSLTSGNLHDILPMCAADARIAAWVKPFAPFKLNVSPAYTWEPVIFRGARTGRDHSERTARDHIATNPRLKGGLIGAKPEAFCAWVLDLLGYRPGIDTMADLFPGTGVMGRVVARRNGELAAVGDEAATLFEDGAA